MVLEIGKNDVDDDESAARTLGVIPADEEIFSAAALEKNIRTQSR